MILLVVFVILFIFFLSFSVFVCNLKFVVLGMVIIGLIMFDCLKNVSLFFRVFFIERKVMMFFFVNVFFEME